METMYHYYEDGYDFYNEKGEDIITGLTGKKIKLNNNTPYLDKVRLYLSDSGTCFLKFITKSKEAMIELCASLVDTDGWNIQITANDKPDLCFSINITLISKNKKLTGYKKGWRISMVTEDIRKIDVMDTEHHMKCNALTYEYD